MRIKNFIIALCIGIFYKNWCLTVNPLNYQIIVATIFCIAIVFVSLNGLDNWWKEICDEREN